MNIGRNMINVKFRNINIFKMSEEEMRQKQLKDPSSCIKSKERENSAPGCSFYFKLRSFSIQKQYSFILFTFQYKASSFFSPEFIWRRTAMDQHRLSFTGVIVVCAWQEYLSRKPRFIRVPETNMQMGEWCILYIPDSAGCTENIVRFTF